MKSKYTVMRKEFKKCGRETRAIIFKFMPKLLKASKEIKKADKLDIDISDSQTESIVIDIVELLSQIAPNMKLSSHILYENIRDLEKIDSDKLQSYLKSKGISYMSFAHKFNEQLKNSVIFILLFAIMEKENINILDLNNPDYATKLMNGSSITDIFEEMIDELSPDAVDLCSELFTEDFDPKNLSYELAELLETSHESFMSEHIYSQVTKPNVSEKDVLRLSKKLL